MAATKEFFQTKCARLKCGRYKGIGELQRLPRLRPRRYI
jgi:hypothetical protein